MYQVGIDIGSSAAKVAVIKDDEVAKTMLLDTGFSSRKVADKIYESLASEGITKDNAKYVATGYGQDTKGISLKRGRVMKFIMNDKCSAGTGKFLEVMTGRLGLTLEELSDLAREGNEISISSMCTVFAESEVISLIGKGTPRADIAFGVIESVINKVVALIAQVPADKYFLTGGLCEDDYVRERLELALNAPVKSTPLARYAGAIGAAILAAEE